MSMETCECLLFTGDVGCKLVQGERSIEAGDTKADFTSLREIRTKYAL